MARIAGYVFLAIILAIALLVPWQTLTGSLSRWESTTVLDRLLLRHATWYNWAALLDVRQNAYARWVPIWCWNSLRISTLTAVICSVTSITAGYAMARLHFPGRATFLSVNMLMMVVPGLMMFIPIYLVTYKLGIRGWWGMVLSGGYSAGTAIMTRQFALGLASEVLDAGRVDGCNEWQLLAYVGFPLLRPLLGMTFASTFAAQWNNLLWSNVMLKGQGEWTLPQGIMYIIATMTTQSQAKNYGMICALGVLSLILPVALFIAMQKQVQEGMEGLIRE